MNALIIAGGAVDDKSICNLVKKGAYECIIAADSGMDVLYRNHITPNYIVGDFDSANSDALSYYRDLEQVTIEELNPVKDDTDTEHALRRCIDMGFETITLTGALGDRFDHSLSNISLLGIGMEAGVNVTIVGVKNRIRLLTGKTILKRAEAFGAFLSLIPYQGKVKGLSISGTKYELQDMDMEPFTSLGVSNEIVSQEVVIDFKEGILLMIESRD